MPSTQAPLPATKITAFPSTSTWTMTPGCKLIRVVLIGAGGGGGGGVAAASGTARGGGAGGCGGGIVDRFFQLSDIPSPVTVTVGAHGTGGPPVTNNATANNGVTGGDTSFGAYAVAKGGSFGSAGTATISPSGNVWPQGLGNFPGAIGGTGRIGTGSTDAQALAPGAPGGGGGMGVATSPAAGVGGNGGYGGYSYTQNAPAGGTNAGGNGTAGDNTIINFTCGTGGGGGGTNGTTAVGNGGAGGIGAGGGGGGGIAATAVASGAGGNGGEGYAWIVEFF